MMKFEKVSISVDRVAQWRKWPWNEWKSPPTWVREPPSTTKFLEWGNIAGKLMRVKKEMDESANPEMNLHVIWTETVEKHLKTLLNQMATLLPPQNDKGSTWGTRARTLSSSQIAKHCCSIFLRGRWYSQGTVDRWHLRRSVILANLPRESFGALWKKFQSKCVWFWPIFTYLIHPHVGWKPPFR